MDKLQGEGVRLIRHMWAGFFRMETTLAVFIRRRSQRMLWLGLFNRPQSLIQS